MKIVAGIYAWFVDEDNRMFYIGQARGKKPEYRAGRFRIPTGVKSANPFTRNVLNKAYIEGKTVSFDWLETFDSCVEPDVLNEAETFWIQYFRSIGVELTNSDDGGGGFVRTQAMIRRLTEAQAAVDQKKKGARISVAATRNRKKKDIVERHAAGVKAAMQRPNVRQKQLDGIKKYWEMKMNSYQVSFEGYLSGENVFSFNFKKLMSREEIEKLFPGWKIHDAGSAAHRWQISPK